MSRSSQTHSAVSKSLHGPLSKQIGSKTGGEKTKPGQQNIEPKGQARSSVPSKLEFKNDTSEANDDEDSMLERELSHPVQFRKETEEQTNESKKETCDGNKQSRYPSKKLALKMQKESHKKALMDSLRSENSNKENTFLLHSCESDDNVESGLEEDYSDLIADGIVPKAASKPSRNGKKSWNILTNQQPPIMQLDDITMQEQVTISVCSRCAKVMNELGETDFEAIGKRKSASHQNSTEKLENDESVVFDQGVDSSRGFQWKFATGDSDTESVTNFMTRKQNFFRTSTSSVANDTFRVDSSREIMDGSPKRKAAVSSSRETVRSSPSKSKGWVGSHLDSSDEDF